jgi:hypothetical protein
MHRRRTILLLVAAAAFVALVVLVEPAAAQAGNPSDAGDNFAEFMRKLLTPVLFTIAAAIGIAAVVRRDWGLAITLVGLVLVVGSFLVKNTPWQSFTESVAKQVFGQK